MSTQETISVLKQFIIIISHRMQLLNEHGHFTMTNQFCRHI